MRTFNELPKKVQEEIKNTLKAYSEVFVVYENGKYNVGVGVALKSHYATDHEVIGTFYSKDIFTLEERIINYAEAFHEFHPAYKGKRDYRMMNELKGKWDTRFALEGGNLVII